MPRAYSLLVLLWTLTIALQAGPEAQAPLDPLEKKVTSFDLRDETFVDGFAKLNLQTEISIAIEFLLKEHVSDPNIRYQPLTAHIEAGTVRQAVNRLCALDNRFTWSRYKSTINIYPHYSSELRQIYFMNKRLPNLSIKAISDPAQALFQTIAALPGPLEQVAFLQSGGTPGFSRPWDLSLDRATLRQAFDEIAEHLGRGYGWTLGGAKEFRVVRFHAKLLAEADRTPNDKQH